MSKMSKKIKSARYLQQYEHLFACPICQQNMRIDDLSRIICDNHHTFDLAKQGYINLLNKTFTTNYDKQLFLARQHILTKTTIYHSVMQAIANIIETSTQSKQPVIVDMGCGEGSHLVQICRQLSKPSVGIGFDISKEAIATATNHEDSMIWSVADLAQLPLKDHQADVIINFLSPSNYTEFDRVLHENGLMIKVVPNEYYLQEIRQHLFHDTNKASYSNQAVVDRFREKYHLITQQTIREVHKIDPLTLDTFIQMTPLTWSASRKQLEELTHANIEQLTIDLDILIGKSIS